MRLMIITQKCDENDDVLGFMHGWIAEFARQTERVSVVCLERVEVNLPENVKVFSLGKEERFKIQDSRFKLGKRLRYAGRFVRYIVATRNEYDAVLVHMNPEYVALGGWLWKLAGKTVALWYAHKSVPMYLRVALPFTDVVFTSTRSGFRLPSAKVRVVGQGIDTEKFKVESLKLKVKGEKFRIVTVGRIAPSKDYGTLIEAVSRVREKTTAPFQVSIIGPVGSDADREYLAGLKAAVAKNQLDDMVAFLPPIPNKDVPEMLQTADLFVNMGRTGSLDKAVPEAMACGVPVLTSNEAFEDVLGSYTRDLMYPAGDAQALAEKILRMMQMPAEERAALGAALREIVVRDHSLTAFVSKIIGEMKKYVCR